MTITAKRKREMQAAGVKFGCFVNIESTGDGPYLDCCIDYDFRGECIHADQIRSREKCRHWREIVEIEKEGEKQ